MSDINLLPKSTIGPQKQDYTALLLQRISFVFLFTTAVITISLFVLVISSPLGKVKQEENSLLATLDLSKEKISKNVIINERLLSIGKVLKERNSYEKNIAIVLSILPQPITITALQVNEKNLQMSGNSPSLDLVNTFIDQMLEKQNKKEAIQSVTLQSFAMQKETKKYYFTLNIIFL